MRKNYMILFGALVLLSAVSCGSGKKTNNEAESEPKETANVPQFNADSAYQYVKQQVDFGPRVPNTKAHVDCGNYIAKQLETFGAKVTNQYADLLAYDGTLLKARNIIGSYKPESKKRIAIFAHWDSRPWADNDPNEKNHHTPVLGANDGASGAGMMLEFARIIQQQQPEMGIDLIFVDAEDYGAHQTYPGEHKEEYWCLGSQYWARNPHVQGYNARFGILLDMVGGKNTVFYKEAYSEKYASDINKKVWKAAKKLGYDTYFIDSEGGRSTDDHLFINEIARIKTIDIIPFDPSGEYDFTPVWHTVNDNMDSIDKATLQAVGQTVLHVIYNEK